MKLSPSAIETAEAPTIGSKGKPTVLKVRDLKSMLKESILNILGEELTMPTMTIFVRLGEKATFGTPLYPT